MIVGNVDPRTFIREYISMKKHWTVAIFATIVQRTKTNIVITNF